MGWGEMHESKRVDTIARLVPLCPECRSPLIERPPDRRFIENHQYVQCEFGHTWHLELANPWRPN